ncbi:MAG: mechanosensitive ion channel family protein [Clostridiales bacterium]|nr:mechanosensitive ion channel family protein [Clostridiales bacterium]
MEEYIARYSVPALIIAGSLVAGFLGDRIVIARVRAASAARGWIGGEITAQALQGTLVLLAGLAGAWGALASLYPAPRIERMATVVLTVAAIMVVTVVAARLTAGLIRAYTSRENAMLPQSTIFINIARLAVVAVGLLIALNAMGVSITPLLTALGVGGLAVALALQDTLSNLFSGLQLIGSRQIAVGQYIRLESGEEGRVEDLTWRYTAIRQLSNNLVIVPNATLAQSLIINFDQDEHETSVLVPAGVSYASDLERVEQVTIEVAREVMARTQAPFDDFDPFIRYNELGDEAIGFNVILRAHEITDQHVLRHEFIKALKTRYEAEGIEIHFPQRAVNIKGA